MNMPYISAELDPTKLKWHRQHSQDGYTLMIDGIRIEIPAQHIVELRKATAEMMNDHTKRLKAEAIAAQAKLDAL
jgi:ligand-binding SRPBCC domain-containing protein